MAGEVGGDRLGWRQQGSHPGGGSAGRRHRARQPHRRAGSTAALGVGHSSHAWVLVLHADSRLPDTWHQKVGAILNRPKAHLSSWCFDFKVETHGRPMLWLLERMVNLRSRWLQRPYGDQGLLIQRQLYERVGGYRPLALMEDLDLVERLSQVAPLRSLNCALLTSAERWQKRSVLVQAWRNARLRWLWRQGRSTEQLLRLYRR